MILGIAVILITEHAHLLINKTVQFYNLNIFISIKELIVKVFI